MKKSIKWENLIDYKVRADFNITLDKIRHPLSKIEDFCSDIVSAGKEVLFDEKEADPEWFELNKVFLRPLLSQRNELLCQARNSEGEDTLLKRKCVDARRNARDPVFLSKGRWV